MLDHSPAPDPGMQGAGGSGDEAMIQPRSNLGLTSCNPPGAATNSLCNSRPRTPSLPPKLRQPALSRGQSCPAQCLCLFHVRGKHAFEAWQSIFTLFLSVACCFLRCRYHFATHAVSLARRFLYGRCVSDLFHQFLNSATLLVVGYFVRFF